MNTHEESTVVVHNHVRHERDTRSGLNGFRAWREEVSDKIEPCDCGWQPAKPPHYRVKRSHK
jgi:hypothetical protein